MAIATLLAQKSRSREIVAAAHIATLSWCFTYFWYYLFAGSNITWGYAVIDATVAAIFWRRAQTAVFATPLYLIHAACVVLYFTTTLFELTEWWVFAILNRLFEAEILYLSWCAAYRIRAVRLNNRERAARMR